MLRSFRAIAGTVRFGEMSRSSASRQSLENGEQVFDRRCTRCDFVKETTLIEFAKVMIEALRVKIVLSEQVTKNMATSLITTSSTISKLSQRTQLRPHTTIGNLSQFHTTPPSERCHHAATVQGDDRFLQPVDVANNLSGHGLTEVFGQVTGRLCLIGNRFDMHDV